MFEIKWEKRALQELSKLEKTIISRIYNKIGNLSSGFHFRDVKRIKEENNFRLRVGDYRIIFSLKNNKITIWKVGHRKNIYKK